MEDATEREALLLRHLHAAAAHGMRGLVQHRSLVCGVGTAHVLYVCRDRGSKAEASERLEIWKQLAEWHLSGLPKDAAGWADPSLEELPVDLPADR